MSQESRFNGKVHKFIIIPVCTIYNDANEIVEEKRMKPIQHFAANDIDLKKVADKLTDETNARFFSKLTPP